jgi:hypothetical protein
MFITINMNHWRAVKAWLDANGGQATLDMASHELEVRARNRYYRLHPQFLAEVGGRMTHVTALTSQAKSFIGWRPYRPLQCQLSSDKLVFKKAIAEARLRTPRHWLKPEQAESDFVLKRSVGSFGYQLAGPFHAGQTLPSRLPKSLQSEDQPGKVYAEQFVQGLNLKAWFWDGQPVHVQCHPYATVKGDGQRTVQALAAERMQAVGESWEAFKERDVLRGCLAYQGVEPSTVLSIGQEVWLDYRYGRGFVAPAVTEAEDNAWSSLDPEVRSQIESAGQHLAAEIRREASSPLLFSVDGVLDSKGAVWWLELNSNPMCPPTAYFPMFATLFGTSATPPPSAYVRSSRTARQPSSRPAPRPKTQTAVESA